MPPLFSIIVVHYQGAVPHETFVRGIRSVKSQTFRDYELLCYHDGPLLDASLPMPVPVRCSEQRFNDFGHSLRDRGIREASGQYIVHFNADNILYPHALFEISKAIHRPALMKTPDGKELDANNIIIFPILMFGLQRVNGQVVQFKPPPGQTELTFYTILTGNPPMPQNIDCMQLVMRRQLWLAEGGWSDKRAASDGILYQRFAQKYGYREVGPVLGEHR